MLSIALLHRLVRVAQMAQQLIGVPLGIELVDGADQLELESVGQRFAVDQGQQAGHHRLVAQVDQQDQGRIVHRDASAGGRLDIRRGNLGGF